MTIASCATWKSARFDGNPMRSDETAGKTGETSDRTFMGNLLGGISSSRRNAGKGCYRGHKKHERRDSFRKRAFREMRRVGDYSSLTARLLGVGSWRAGAA